MQRKSRFFSGAYERGLFLEGLNIVYYIWDKKALKKKRWKIFWWKKGACNGRTNTSKNNHNENKEQGMVWYRLSYESL